MGADQITQIVSSDDYMPMAIKNIKEFDNVLNVSWYTPDKPKEEQGLAINIISSTPVWP
jgi:exocyst complex component 6